MEWGDNIDLNKEEMTEVIRDLIDEDKLEDFKKSTVAFGIGFEVKKDKEGELEPSQLALRMIKNLNEVEDFDDKFKSLEKDLDYDEWGMSLIYAAANIQVANEEEDEELNYIR